MTEDYYKDGYFYYFKLKDGDWQVAKLSDGKFEMDKGLFTTLNDLIDQCGVENLIRIPLAEELK